MTTKSFIKKAATGLLIIGLLDRFIAPYFGSQIDFKGILTQRGFTYLQIKHGLE
jgi:hypothetical protein